MFKEAHPLFMICTTPTHVGSGSDLGIIDLPIQRERHTGFPKFEASSLKGSLREAFERNSSYSKAFSAPNDYDAMLHRLFGYDEGSLNDHQKGNLKKHFIRQKGKNDRGEVITEEQTSFAGALGFSDARLLLFPVKSMKGVFGWITCFKVLKQVISDLKLTDNSFDLTELNQLFSNGITGGAYLFNPESNLKIGDNIVLEEYSFNIKNYLNEVVQVNYKDKLINFPDWLAQKLFGNNGSYWSEKIKKDIVVLPDDDFKDFVNLSTEVITRTKINNETGTVATGALFNEEYLPAETIMYTLVLAAPEFRAQQGDISPLNAKEVYRFFEQHLPKTIQIGGNATLGKGIISTKLLNSLEHE